MRHLHLIIFLFLGLVSWAKVYSVEDIPNVQLQDASRYLSNPDNIISEECAARIDSLLCDITRRTSVEMAVVVVDEIDTDDIDSFATELFTKWGIGKNQNDNGVLMLVAKDQHQAVIRTGYGIEGVLPDILVGRTLNDIMFPFFKSGDYDKGVLYGVKDIRRLVTNPDAAAELKAQLEDEESADMLNALLTWWSYGALASLVMLVILLACLYSWRKKSDYQKYLASNDLTLIFWIAGVFFLGVPIIIALPLTLLRGHWRNHNRNCPHCSAPMTKLDEVSDNYYLTAGQDLEERIKSVDYDVWRCPNCGQLEINRFINSSTSYRECPKCKHYTMALKGANVVKEPTYTSEGRGEKIYECLNCNHINRQPYDIPRKVSKAEVAASVIGAMASSGRRGGGGFGGGGFGGGSTGGGGASGRW